MIKLRLYDVMERFTKGVVGPFYRRVGKSTTALGLSLQKNLTSDDRLVPSLRCKPHSKQYPSLAQADFVAPNSTVVGNVTIGEESSIWYGATLRGELAQISIGNQAIIQDLVQIQPRASSNVKIGDNVFVGSNAYLESCTLENYSFIGMGASVCNGAKVESFGVVAAGAVVPEGAIVKSNQVWAGNPARYIRDLTPEEKQVIQEHHLETIYLARIHAEETEKSFRQIIDDLDEKENAQFEDSEAQALKKMKELGFPMEFDDEDYIEQRVFLKKANSPQESEFWKKQYDQYEQDLFHFPDSFKQYGENYQQYEDAKKYFDESPYVEATNPRNPNEFEYPKDNHSWTRKF